MCVFIFGNVFNVRKDGKFMGIAVNAYMYIYVYKCTSTIFNIHR